MTSMSSKQTAYPECVVCTAEACSIAESGQSAPQVSKISFCSCSNQVLTFLAIVFSLALGLIFGIVYAADLLIAVPALIILAVVLGILVIAALIFYLCYCRRRCPCCC
jgi:hypothetical protein